MFKYLIHGLKVESVIELNCYVDNSDSSDIKIEFGDNLTGYSDTYFYIDVSDEVIKLNFTTVGIFEVINGNKIIMNCVHDADPRAIEMFLLAQVFAALLIQRGTFPLHGSTVVKNGVGITIVGSAGSGKSTLSTALMQKGWKMVTDDIISVGFSDNLPMVYPSFPFQKIWRETADNLNVDLTNCKCLYDRKEKFYIENRSLFSDKNTEIQYLIEISVGDTSEVKTTVLSERATLPLLINNSYRYHIVKESNQLFAHMQFIAKLCSSLKCFTLERPKGLFTAEEQLKKIEEMVGFI